jgi:hypothetical protein
VTKKRKKDGRKGASGGGKATATFARRTVDTKASAAPAAIITPIVDTICSGGLSVAVIIGLLFYGVVYPDGRTVTFSFDLFLVTNLVINWPHFMASYWLLYSNRQNLRTHPMVAVVLPLVLFGFIAYSFVVALINPAGAAESPRFVMQVLGPLSPLLLAWHYTGQSWGMTACFAFIAGLRMSVGERRLIRSGFLTLAVFHVLLSWEVMNAAQTFGPQAELAEAVLAFALATCRLAVVATVLAGLLGFRRLAVRHGRSIPVRCWLPWAATFGWYALVDILPGWFVLLQVFHALQYLTFPLRVEANQHAAASTGARRVRLHMALYYLALVVVGGAAFIGPSRLESISAIIPLGAMVAIGINVHHYFTDGVLWKIRNPEVREALFGHLQLPGSGGPAPSRRH